MQIICANDGLFTNGNRMNVAKHVCKPFKDGGQTPWFLWSLQYEWDIQLLLNYLHLLFKLDFY